MDTEEQVLDTAQNEAVDASEQIDEELDFESEVEEPEAKPEEPDYKALLEAEKARNAKLYARLKKSTQTMPTKAPEVNSLTRDEAILIAKGYSEEEIKVLNRIKKGAEAEGTKMSFLEASDDEVFKAWKSKVDAQARSKKAQLGASGGSTSKQVEVAKMTDEEHKEYFQKKVKEAL
jgi:transcription initiation factor IIF auxiliary subunit